MTPDERRPSEPTPGSIEAVAYRTGCAWVSNAVSSQRSPEDRGTPTMDRTWYPVLYAENPHDTIYVDTTHAHRMTREPSLVSVWMRMTLHSTDSLVINGKRASYIMAEDHVRCVDLKLMKLATIQFLAFDGRDVFLGAGDTPDRHCTQSLKERESGLPLPWMRSRAAPTADTLRADERCGDKLDPLRVIGRIWWRHTASAGAFALLTSTRPGRDGGIAAGRLSIRSTSGPNLPGFISRRALSAWPSAASRL